MERVVESTETFTKVVDIMAPFTKNKEALAQASAGTKILEDLNVNSARLVDIILAFEDNFDIQVDDDAADQVITIGDAVKLIDGLKN